MEENRCIICGKKLHDPLAVYCAECEYELKRVRLADEESLEEWVDRMSESRMYAHNDTEFEKIKTLDAWF
ncbi:MAG: hypothetical protein GXO25_04835 [Euryarchaeota archaeon]|nr:hypothetical protein [Euryarchaeota archaeon]